MYSFKKLKRYLHSFEKQKGKIQISDYHKHLKLSKKFYLTFILNENDLFLHFIEEFCPNFYVHNILF